MDLGRLQEGKINRFPLIITATRFYIGKGVRSVGPDAPYSVVRCYGNPMFFSHLLRSVNPNMKVLMHDARSYYLVYDALL